MDVGTNQGYVLEFAATRPPATSFERIDLFYSAGLPAVDAKRIVTPAQLTLPGYASDHAGVIAEFRP
jgi:hypothetical protein